MRFNSALFTNCLFSWLLLKSLLMELVKVPAVPSSCMTWVQMPKTCVTATLSKHVAIIPVLPWEDRRQRQQSPQNPGASWPGAHTDWLKQGGRWELLPEVVLWPPPLSPPQIQFSLNNPTFRKELEQLLYNQWLNWPCGWISVFWNRYQVSMKHHLLWSLLCDPNLIENHLNGSAIAHCLQLCDNAWITSGQKWFGNAGATMFFFFKPENNRLKYMLFKS